MSATTQISIVSMTAINQLLLDSYGIRTFIRSEGNYTLAEIFGEKKVLIDLFLQKLNSKFGEGKMPSIDPSLTRSGLLYLLQKTL